MAQAIAFRASQAVSFWDQSSFQGAVKRDAGQELPRFPERFRSAIGLDFLVMNLQKLLECFFFLDLWP
jgi:hypothetical protein